MNVCGKALFCVIACCLCSAWAGCARPHDKPPIVASSPLPAPTLLSPESGARMHHFPRTVVFKWAEVPGAAGYGIQVDCFLCCDTWRWCSEVGKSTFTDWAVKDTTFEFSFYGNQPGAWRVWALDKHQRPGQPSEWRGFSFSAENVVNPLPRLPSVTALPEPPAFPSRPAEKRASAEAHTTPPATLAATAPPPASTPVYDTASGEACGTTNERPVPGITMPKPIYTPEPQYTETARKAKVSGTVYMVIDLGSDGLVKHVCLVRGFRKDVDEQAIKTVRTWKFEPARKDGAAIPYSTTVYVSFSLY
jgi:TonB family protein